MALNDVVFTYRQGGLGYPTPNYDHYSGMIFYDDTLPAGFGASDRIKLITSVQQAEDLGLVDTHTDETKATGGQATMTAIGAIGTTWTIKIGDAIIATFDVTAAETTVDLLAAALRTAINAGTSDHGIVAAGATAVVTLAIPTGWGICGNGATHNAIAFTNSGVGAATVVQASAGVGSKLAVFHYHISEFFRMQPKGILYVGIYAVPATFDGAEIKTVQDFSEGKIRQMAIYHSDDTFTSGQITSIQTILDTIHTEHRPTVCLFHSDATGMLATLPDISTLSAEGVGFVLGQEGDFSEATYVDATAYLIGAKVFWGNSVYQAKQSTTGNAPFDTTYWSYVRENLKNITGYSISTIGCTLGVLATAKVNECIAWPEKFNVVTGINLDNLALATGDLYRSSLSSLELLNTEHYIFLRKLQDVTGSYHNDSWTAIAGTKDYCTLENNRTAFKAERLCYAALVTKLASPLYVNADGTLSNNTIEVFKGILTSVLDDMLSSSLDSANGEISEYSVDIDSTQDVLSTSKLEVSITLVPVGVARQIAVNIGYEINAVKA